MKYKRPSASPRQGESLLDGLFRRLRLSDQARDWRALSVWREAAGPRIGARVRAERMRGSTMVLRAASAAWANELGYLRAQLLERLRATPGAEWVKELHFTVGPLDEAPDFGAPDPSDERAPPAPTATRPTIEPGAIAEELRQVTDPELRSALAELLARSQSR